MRRRVIISGALVLLALIALGLNWYQPWKLLTSRTIIESPPTFATVYLTGTFVSHEHETAGTVEVVKLAEGRFQVVLRDLSTSDGPDLRVWLTDRELIDGKAGRKIFDDGRWVELGSLKGTHGTHVYEVPAGTDVTQFKSVTIWCKRFAVSFGAAPLTPHS